jgi:peptidyl-tRNA hydrolase, PTH1 family
MLGSINRLLGGSAVESRDGDLQAIIVGLGNPGDQYRTNRHNVGFMAVDRFSERCAPASSRAKFKAHFVKTTIGESAVILLKPQTYMNLSGSSVQEALHFYQLPLGKLIAVHDELDLEFGITRIKVGGGAAGHKGIKSIVEQCGGSDFVRVRIGIGRPQGVKAEHYVLSDFTKAEQRLLPAILDRASEALTQILAEGPQSAMNRFNVRPVQNGE